MDKIYDAMLTLKDRATSAYPDCRGLVITINIPVSTDCVDSLVNAGKVAIYNENGTPRMKARVLQPAT